MPKLPSFTSKRLIKILKKFGFQLDHTTGSHFIFYNPKTKKRVVIPYHVKDLPRGTIFSILKEAGISRKELEKILKKGKIR
jgi:predicted RNA binding protein YcfA (HicA-like mRNA interferase family)